MLDFKELASRVVTVEVDGESVELAYPATSAKGQMLELLRKHDKILKENGISGGTQAGDLTEAQSNALLEANMIWTELVATALQATVRMDNHLSIEDWDRVLSAVARKPVVGFTNLTNEALALCGFAVSKKDEDEAVTDNVKETVDEVLTDSPS